jgi:hypothetical protein
MTYINNNKNLSFTYRMKNISDLCDQLVTLIGEETLGRELEGILRKHEGIARRQRRPGRVALCVSSLADLIIRGDLTPRMIARCATSHSLSIASTYRLVQCLHKKGIAIRAVDILREMERMKAGVY